MGLRIACVYASQTVEMDLAAADAVYAVGKAMPSDLLLKFKRGLAWTD